MNLIASALPALALACFGALPGSASETWKGPFIQQDDACPASVQRVEISFDYRSQAVLVVSAGRLVLVFNIDLPPSDGNRRRSAVVFCRYSGENPPQDKDVLYFKLHVPEQPLDTQPALLRIKNAGSRHLLYLEPLPEG